ncbi:cerebellin-1-like [Betta splendens]|uniref:Cerebellin-1-like n=1 Tax=Betta splendens TaxID=158456 RepID=A0A6P7P005_BETSP|nr:cerebellin-1-like [Betta splendens]
MSAQSIEMKHRLAVIEARLEASENQIEELKKKESTMVMFTAIIQKGGAYGPFNTNVTLTYNNVIMNIGDGYNSSTGIFVAPVAGVYYFTFSYHAGGHEKTILDMYKNSTLIVRSSDHKSNVVTAHNGGNASFLQLVKGDQVYVRMLAQSHIWAAELHTTFSGFLVSPM